MKYLLFKKIIAHSLFLGFVLLCGNLQSVQAEQYVEATILKVEKASTLQLGDILTVSIPSLATTTTIINDRVRLDVGEQVYVRYDPESQVPFSLFEVKKKNALWLIFVLFVGVVIAVNGRKGARSIVALFLTMGVIGGVLIPLLIAGYSPLFTTISLALLILAMALYTTHGIVRDTHLAFTSASLAVICTGILAYIIFPLLNLSDTPLEELAILQVLNVPIATITSLIFAGIIIGTLGVVDDVAITQIATVRELRSVNKNLSLKELFTRAFRIGQEHTAALVNTLALAYVGAALPLVVLLAQAPQGIWITLQQEPVVIEILRIVIGSIGVLLVVPIATLAGVFYGRHENNDSTHVGHGHNHSHFSE